VTTIILGDMLAGLIFGVLITTLVLIVGASFIQIGIANILLLPLALFLGSCCFAALGVLLASHASRAPSNVMMLSSLIRFPLIFISGVFIPLGELGGAELTISYFSPLTYLVDMFNACFNGTSRFPLGLDVIGSLLFICAFLFAAIKIQKRNLSRGL
jgi:ABC-2 type transport system permease protein